MEQVCFSRIEDFLSANIASASERIYVAVAWFTNDVLFNELHKALKRKVEVKVILLNDILNRNEFGLNFGVLIENNADVRFASPSRGTMHNKFCIIDDKVITGSYNWTYYANTNDENIVLIDDPNIVVAYCKQFEKLFNVCEPTVLPYEHLKWIEIKEGDFIELRRNIIRDVRSHHDVNSKKKEEKLILLNKAFSSGNAEELVKASSFTIADVELIIGHDKRGVPILKKTRQPKKLCYWLNNISIETVPKGRPNEGRKYIHAKYTTNFRDKDEWVDIFDSEFVNDVLKYFHKKDGGCIDNSLPLPNIPEEIYNTRLKYTFEGVRYYFDKYGRYGTEGSERKKLGNDGQFITDRSGRPYIYDHFVTLIRYDKDKKDYIEFGSMTELCHLIVSSLFVPDRVNDFDEIASENYLSGVFKASIDDLREICIIEGLGQQLPQAQSTIDLFKELLLNASDRFWIYKYGGHIFSYAYGIYTHTPSCIDKNETWFKLQRLKASSINYQNDKFRELVNKMIVDLKTLGKKGILYECGNQQVNYFERLGFVRDSKVSQTKGQEVWKLRLTFY
ncbi:MAG: FAM83 family protein [Bacteroidaceae bacterium]|nr:FAM83 family protein [Bacteroidaceae bacterium]